MLSFFENTAPLESFSIAKIRSLIKYNIERIFTDELLSRPFVQLYIERECEGPLLDYVNLVSFYLVSPQTEGYDESVKIFLTKYEAFMETYKGTLLKNGFNRPVCAGIAIIWLRVIEYMDGQAKNAGDMLLRSVAMQLDRDMIYSIENLFSD